MVGLAACVERMCEGAFVHKTKKYYRKLLKWHNIHLQHSKKHPHPTIQASKRAGKSFSHIGIFFASIFFGGYLIFINFVVSLILPV